MDARSKLLCLLILIAAVASASSFWGYALIFAFTVSTAVISKLPLKTVTAPVYRMTTFFLLIFLMNAFFYKSEAVAWTWWIFNLSEEGICQGLRVVIRIALIVVLGNILTMTTTPMDMTTALESLVKPLKLFRVPTEDIAMIISAAIQFIPVLMEESDMIRMAQTARGARFESKKLSERAASLLPLVIPIFISAFRRADELSLAMEARGYRGARNRTKRKRDPLRLRDHLSLLVCSAVCASQFALLL